MHHVAIAARPVEPPVFPVANPHPDRAIRADDLGFHAQPVPLDVLDGDAAGQLGALARPLAEDLKRIHRQRENHVPFAQVVQAPGAEQMREVINNDEVGVELRRLSRLHQRAPGQHADASLNPVAAQLADARNRLARDRETATALRRPSVR